MQRHRKDKQVAAALRHDGLEPVAFKLQQPSLCRCPLLKFSRRSEIIRRRKIVRVCVCVQACVKTSRAHTHTHVHAQCEYFMCRVTALVRSHKCHPASFAHAPPPSSPLSLSLSLRCSGEANELGLQMKPSSITTHTQRPFLFFFFSLLSLLPSRNHFESVERESVAPRPPLRLPPPHPNPTPPSLPPRQSERHPVVFFLGGGH